jgi:endonuclease/exonuclease/phosphatase family metal-dependent hydrolase
MLLRRGIDLTSMTHFSLPSLEPRGAVIWRLRSGERRLTVVGTHLGLVGHWRKLQAMEIARRIAREDEVSTVVAGDMNEWRRGGRSLDAIERVLGSCTVGGPSFPSRSPFLVLDRVAAGKGASIASWEVIQSGPASDHRPLLACVNC